MKQTVKRRVLFVLVFSALCLFIGTQNEDVVSLLAQSDSGNSEPTTEQSKTFLPLLTNSGQSSNGSDDTNADCEIDEFLLEHAGVQECLSTPTLNETSQNSFDTLIQAAETGVDPWGRPRENFVSWENAHVYPLDLTPNGNTLLAVNTPDNSLMVFDVSNGTLQQLASIPVGLDPVSVRARTDNEVWVVNHVSDSISVVDLAQGRVIATLQPMMNQQTSSLPARRSGPLSPPHRPIGSTFSIRLTFLPRPNRSLSMVKIPVRWPSATMASKSMPPSSNRATAPRLLPVVKPTIGNTIWSGTQRGRMVAWASRQMMAKITTHPSTQMPMCRVRSA